MDEAVQNRILYLLNQSLVRKLTTDEQEFFDEHFDNYMNHVGDAPIDIGGADLPREVDSDVADASGIRQVRLRVIDDDDSDGDDSVDGELSDVDNSPDFIPVLHDLRVEQVGDDIAQEQEVQMQQSSGEQWQREIVEEEPIEPNRGMRYTARNSKHSDIWWSLPDAIEKQRVIRDRNERLKYDAACLVTFENKCDAFKRLFPSALVQGIVLETNRKAKRYYENNRLSQNQKILRRWYDTGEDEIYAYIAVLLYAGAEKSCKVEAKDLFHVTHMPFYRSTMSLERFEQLSRFIRFDDSRTRPLRLKTDKLAAFRHVWNAFQQTLTEAYQPSKELTIDEQLVTTRGRCSFRQFIPSKPGKYGIKIFWIVDAITNYPLHGEVYVGQQPGENRSRGVSHELVTRLSEKYLDKGVNITMDNFFTSVPLALELKGRNTTLVGTIKPVKPELPMPFTLPEKNFKKTRQPYSSLFCFSRCLQLVSYASNTRRNVLLLSTAHHSEEVDETTKKNQVILDYNKTKGGVDTFDQLNRVYSCKRKTNRWPVTLFYNLLDIAALGAYRMYDLSNPLWYSSKKKSKKRKIFLKSLALELAANHIKTRMQKPNLQNSVKTAMKLIGYEISTNTSFPPIRTNTKDKRRCESCKADRKSNRSDNKTTAICDICGTATCTKHYIRVCEKCYTSDAAPGEIEENNDGTFMDMNTPSTSSEPPRKRIRAHSPT